MKSTLTRAALILLMATAALPARAQFEKFPGVVKQIEVGYGLSFGTADYKIKINGVTEGGTAKDTTITTSVRTKAGVTYQFGTSIRLKRLGMKSTLALGVGLNYGAYLWDFPVPTSATLADSGFRFKYGDITFGGASVNMGLALTADFKFGVDAMMDKQYRWGYTVGFGVMPSMNATTDANIDADFKFGVQPVIKGEIALRAGIVMKLRAQAAFGNITYLDKSGDGYVSGSKMQTQIIGKSNFTISYILMPFSFMYKKSEWYNTY
jgi:hypothetical protein